MAAVGVSYGQGVVVTHPDLVNLHGCSIGEETRIGPFVEIMAGTVVGRRCKISSHSVIGAMVSIEDGVFVGHGVVIADDARQLGNGAPPATTIGAGASIGSRATVLAGCVIGGGAMVGAGAVVVRDVPPFAIVAGVPGVVVGDVRHRRDAARPASPAALQALDDSENGGQGNVHTQSKSTINA
jgi:acetyltransferase-like isoleucine patch superfamily enzyme